MDLPEFNYRNLHSSMLKVVGAHQRIRESIQNHASELQAVRDERDKTLNAEAGLKSDK